MLFYLASNVRQIVPQVVAQLVSIPWGHHRYIMDKCDNDAQKTMFYVRKTLEIENTKNKLYLQNSKNISIFAVMKRIDYFTKNN